MFQGLNTQKNIKLCLTGQKIDGIQVANSVKERVKAAVEELKKEKIEPCLATILV